MYLRKTGRIGDFGSLETEMNDWLTQPENAQLKTCSGIQSSQQVLVEGKDRAKATFLVRQNETLPDLNFQYNKTGFIPGSDSPKTSPLVMCHFKFGDCPTMNTSQFYLDKNIDKI